MTTPPDGSAPYGQPYQQQPPAAPYGQPAPGYPAAPPPPGYGAPAYGAPGYPPPGYGVPAGPQRPGTVTAAAVLSFIWGGFSILGSIISLAAGSFLSGANDLCDSVTSQLNDAASGAACDTVTSAGGFLIVIGIILIVAAALLIWGGVVALSGKNGKVGVIAGALLIVAQIVSLIASGFSGVAFSIFGIVVPVLIIAFLMNASARNWFRSKGGATF